MGVPDRLYNIAKSQLGKAKDRWEEMDVKAQQEIDEFMSRYSNTNGQSAWDRAMGKINAAQAEQELNSGHAQIDNVRPEPNLDEMQTKLAVERAAAIRDNPAQLAQPQTQTLVAAYKMLGVEPGADWLTIQSAYAKIRERAAPERFPEGSTERETAQSIQRRVDSAFMMLRNALAPSGDRFDRLEI